MELKDSIANVDYDLDYDDMVHWNNHDCDEEELELNAMNMTGVLFSEVMEITTKNEFYDIEKWSEILSYLHDTLKN